MNIILTGATGFLGGRLIQQLTEEGHVVYLLARNKDRANATIQSVQAENRHQVHIIMGDITKQMCGLSKEEQQNLKGKVHLFYHLAALVKFDLDLEEELRAINVEGTIHALDLAESLDVESFYYVSTAYTVGKGEEGKEQLYPKEGPFNNPYEQTKVAAEYEVWQRREKMNIAIFRPSIIVGDSQTGEANSAFTLYGFMRGMDLFNKRMKRRYAENVPTFYLGGWNEGTSNIVPVDYVANILALAVGRAKPNTIYNITNPNPPRNGESLEIVKDTINFPNLKMVESLNEETLTQENQSMLQLVAVFRPYFSRNIIFDDRNTQKLLEGTKVAHLYMDKTMLQTVIRGYLQT